MQLNDLFDSPRHPAVLTSSGNASLEALLDYLHSHAVSLQQLVRQRGGLLLRGSAVRGAADFARVLDAMGAQLADYVGGNSPRTSLGDGVYTSTEFPASETISLHHEMSYLLRWPARLFFHAAVPAAQGGQTTLASSADVTAQLDPAIVAAFRDKKLRYIRTFHPKSPFGKSWQETYATSDRASVEHIVQEQGSACHWLPGDVLQVSTVCEALQPHPASGEGLWFNQAEQWHPSALRPDVRAMFERAYGAGHLAHHCEHADGTPLDEAMLASVRSVLRANRLLFDWREGDVLVIDNVLMMHGREPYRGARRTLVYLSST